MTEPMRLSVIVVSKDRSLSLLPCLDSIAVALNRAAPLKAELIVVDNGSTDDTASVLGGWVAHSPIRTLTFFEPRPGNARCLNLAMRAASGELLAFTDDDCRLHPDYVKDLLWHDAGDTELVLRGGWVELGDPTDLPYTINTRIKPQHWHRGLYSTRRDGIAGKLNGCNLAMRRALIERLGPFDENFGPGARMESCADADYFFRAYEAGILLEYVPNMGVFHCHGRKTPEQIRALYRSYAIGWGALNAKLGFRHLCFYREIYRDLRALLVKRRRACYSDFSFTPLEHLTCAARGALRYFVFALSATRALPPLFRNGTQIANGQTHP